MRKTIVIILVLAFVGSCIPATAGGIDWKSEIQHPDYWTYAHVIGGIVLPTFLCGITGLSPETASFISARVSVGWEGLDAINPGHDLSISNFSLSESDPRGRDPVDAIMGMAGTYYIGYPLAKWMHPPDKPRLRWNFSSGDLCIEPEWAERRMLEINWWGK